MAPKYELLLTVIVLVLVAFVPALLYVRWIRNSEHYRRNPWGRIFHAFLYGAFIAIIVAAALELIIIATYKVTLQREYEYLQSNRLELIVFAMIVAPFVEEYAKLRGVYAVRSYIKEVEDGLVYGAAAGLGFAATENLIYEGVTFWKAGLYAFITVAVVRSISSALLHASSTAVAGYGLGRKLVEKTWYAVAPYYLLAVGMHALFNFLASFGALYSERLGESAYVIGLMLAIVFAVGAIEFIRIKIRDLDTRKGYG